jgi:serine protease
LVPGLNGTVFNTAGNPAPGREVRAYLIPNATPTLLEKPIHTVTTDASGHYQIQGLMAGMYSLVISDTDSGAVRSNVVLPGLLSGQVAKVLANLRLTPNGRVRGQVLRGSQPLAGVVIGLEQTPFRAVSDTDGNFTLPNVPAGTYTIRTQLPGFLAARTNVTVAGMTDSALPEPLRIQQPGPIIDQLDPPFGVPGQAVTLWGRQFASIPTPFVVAFGNSIVNSDSLTRTDEYITVHVPASARSGPVSIRTASDEWVAPGSFKVLSKIIKASGDGQIPPASGDPLPVPLTVRVLDSEDQPMVGVSVGFIPEGGVVSQNFVYTDSNGAARTSFSPVNPLEEYQVRARVATNMELGEVVFAPPRARLEGSVIPEYNFLSQPTAEFVAGEAVIGLRGPLVQSGLQLERQDASGRGLLRMGAVQTRRRVSASSASGRETLEWITRLRARPDVLYAEPNYVYRALAIPSDPRYDEQWHYPTIDLPQAWDAITGVSNVVVAVIDTGLLWRTSDPARQHPEFACRVAPGSLEKLVSGYDFVNNDTDPFDEGPFSGSFFHGTHVAGTVAACANNGYGGAGVAWNTRLMPIRALDSTGAGTLDGIARAIRWAAGLPVQGTPLNPIRAQVINLSLGAKVPPSQALQEAIDAATSVGTVVVVAAGNESSDASAFSPANQRGVISVGAVGRVSVGFARASYSNFGPSISLVAPGGDISSSKRSWDGVLSTLGCGLSGTIDPPCGADTYGMGFFEGTSMAAPHVAGVVALMMARQPLLANPPASDGPLTWVRVLAALSASASGGIANCERGCGAGLVSAPGALARVATLGMLPAWLTTEASGIELGLTQSSATVAVRNIGGAAGTWSLRAIGPGLSVTPASLSLASGASASVTLSVDRSGITPGQYAGRFEAVSTGNQPLITVRAYYQSGAPSDVGALVLRAERFASGFWHVAKKADLRHPYRFSLEGLPAGRYRVLAYRISSLNLNGWASVDQYGETPAFQLGLGERRGGLDLNLTGKSLEIYEGN